MIQILPITEPSFLERMNQTYHVQATDGFVYIEKKEVKATLLYRVAKGGVEIQSISTVESEVFDGLVRACFAALIDRGIESAAFGEKMDRQLLTELGFVQDDTFVVKSLTESIENGRKCGGV